MSRKLDILVEYYPSVKLATDDDHTSIESSIHANTSDTDSERASSPSIVSSEISEESSSLFSTTLSLSSLPDLCIEMEPNKFDKIENMINTNNLDILWAALDNTIESDEYAKNPVYYECLKVVREIKKNAKKDFLKKVYNDGTLQKYDSVILCKNTEKSEYSFCQTCTKKYVIISNNKSANK